MTQFVGPPGVFVVDVDVPSFRSYDGVMAYFDHAPAVPATRAEAWAWWKSLVREDYEQNRMSKDREEAKIALTAVIVESALLELDQVR